MYFYFTFLSKFGGTSMDQDSDLFWRRARETEKHHYLCRGENSSFFLTKFHRLTLTPVHPPTYRQTQTHATSIDLNTLPLSLSYE